MWQIEAGTFAAFRKALSLPHSIFVTGYLRGTQRSMTLETLMEERDQIVIRSDTGWLARVWAEGRRLKAVQLADGQSKRLRYPPSQTRWTPRKALKVAAGPAKP